MSLETSPASGTVVSVLRYPVKSTLGEELNAAWMGSGGLLGDRAFALISTEDGKVVSAKNPRKWPGMFDCRAGYVDPPRPGEALPPIKITLPDGTTLISGRDDIGGAFSRHFGHAVTLASAPPDQPRLEEYWPDMEELDHRDTVTDESMPTGTFFDLATVHLLTTATLAALGRAYPEGRFEVRRFRPNLVIAPPELEARFMEDDWIDRVLSVGDEVRLRVTGPCPRCVMTTLAQSDLPHDPHILRTAARLNKAHVGVYASVLHPGWIRRGDPVRVLQ